jgi:hypothetical protein
MRGLNLASGGRHVTAEYESILRSKCINRTLYRSDEKLAAWLAVSAGDVPGIVDSLISAGVLIFDGMSSKGTERYKLGDEYRCGASEYSVCRADPFGPECTTHSITDPDASPL